MIGSEADDVEFEHLDAGVQEAFQSFLAERGVDDSLGELILPGRDPVPKRRKC